MRRRSTLFTLNTRGGWHEFLNHYLFVFHDEIVEALAKSVSVRLVRATMRDCLAKVVHEITEI